MNITKLAAEIRNCKICEKYLPYPPKPILQISKKAKITIAGQAPGIKTHFKGIPFDDLSGERLRAWLGVNRECFYNPDNFNIIPMGFCYPGSYIRNGKMSGDKPPRPECRATWHPQIYPNLSNVELTIILGQYAIDYLIRSDPKIGVTQAVANWQQYWPKMIVLPHPSPRNNPWFKRHPEFEKMQLPLLKQRVKSILNSNKSI